MAEIKLKIASVVIGSGEGGGSGVAPYYADLPDKPSINGETLSGDMTSEDLGLASESQAVPSGGTTGQVLAKKSNVDNDVQWVNQQSGGQGTTNYADLENKPKINNVTLSGNKTAAQLGLQPELVSGTNIKTINNQSIVGSGNITIEGGGTDDYTDLGNKPQINSVVLSGNKSASDLGLATAAQGGKADNAIPMPTGTDGQILEKDSNEVGGVKWVPKPQDGEDGLSAFEIAQQQGYTGTVDQWLASLKANIGAFKFITPTDTTAEAALTAIGDIYASAIGSVLPTQSTLSIILLMNDSNNTKTMMIATQDDGSSGFEFVYAGNLQDAMPSNVAFIEDAEADLDIVDDNGSVLARFKNGGFRVKNFDSALTPQQGKKNITPDFAIVDENGKAIAIFRDGHIKTKNFDSSEDIRTPWYGKKVSIIGDSISTAIDHNAVEFTVLASDISEGRTLQGYPTYYDIGTKIGTKTVSSSMVGVLTSFTPASGDAGKTIGKALNYNSVGNSGVASYTDTWWHKLATALGMQVLQNVSWSGASICSHEENNIEYKTSYAWHPAQINKLAKRKAGGSTVAPDVVIIYRGTNDMTHTPYAALTDFGADATSIPDTDFANSSYDFKVAYCLTVKKIREAYPQAKIVLCTLNVFKRVNYSQFPTNNGENTLPEYNNAIREVADMMGCGLIEFDKDGITFENCYPTYISDSSTEPTHPNPTGHTVMAEKAIIDIKKF